MKKFLKTSILIIFMALVVIMCGGCKKKDNKTENETNVIENQTLNNEIKNQTLNNEIVTTTKKEKELERGKWVNNVYTNDFANITFKLPEGWTYSSDEEIAQMLNIGVEALGKDNKEELSKIIEQTGLYDMVSKETSTGTSVMVLFEKPQFKVTTDFYLNNVKSGLEKMDSLDYTIEDVTTAEIAGKEYKLLSTRIPSYNMVQKYYVRPEGNYFISIIITYIEGLTDFNNIISSFQ